MKKKYFTLILLTAFALSCLTGCGNKTKVEASNTDGQDTLKPHRVGSNVDEDDIVNVDIADESFGGYDADEIYSYDIDTMLPDMDTPIISIDELQEMYGDDWDYDWDYDDDFDESTMFRRSLYDYQSGLDYYLIVDDNTVFVLGDDFDEVEAPYDFEFYAYDDNIEYTMIGSGLTYYGGLTNGYADIELGFLNPEYYSVMYDDCRLMSISVMAYPWMDDDEIVWAETVGGITWGMSKDEVHKIMTKYGFDYGKWNDWNSDVQQYVECLDRYNQNDEVGRYVFGFEDDELCQIRIEYIGRK